MNDAAELFRSWCRNSFSFLKGYGFQEARGGLAEERFVAIFEKGDLQLIIRGEGYGAIASVFYRMPDKTEVHTQILEPDWRPSGRQRKKRPKATLTQEQAIAAFAKRIGERDGDILTGDLHRLESAADQWRRLRERMGWT